MKQVAVIQCVKRSKALKRRILRPDSSPGSSAMRPREKIERRERKQHAEHRDAADPGQRTLAEAAVVAALRLLEQRGLAVRNA